jgi:hypothetical protein
VTVSKTKQDLEWEARTDIDTPIHSQEILSDTGRRKRAMDEITRRNAATDKAAQQLRVKVGAKLKEVFK